MSKGRLGMSGWRDLPPKGVWMQVLRVIDEGEEFPYVLLEESGGREWAADVMPLEDRDGNSYGDPPVMIWITEPADNASGKRLPAEPG